MKKKAYQGIELEIKRFNGDELIVASELPSESESLQEPSLPPDGLPIL